MRAASDKTATSAPVHVSHLFGLFGQGEATDGIDKSNKPFFWAKDDDKNIATIQVTILPQEDGQAALDDATKFIKMKAKAV